jgi:hypothetical protein
VLTALERGQGYDDALEVTSGCFFSTATEALAANTDTYAANAATGATTAQPANYDARQRRKPSEGMQSYCQRDDLWQSLHEVHEAQRLETLRRVKTIHDSLITTVQIEHAWHFEDTSFASLTCMTISISTTSQPNMRLPIKIMTGRSINLAL